MGVAVAEQDPGFEQSQEDRLAYSNRILEWLQRPTDALPELTELHANKLQNAFGGAQLSEITRSVATFDPSDRFIAQLILADFEKEIIKKLAGEKRPAAILRKLRLLLQKPSINTFQEVEQSLPRTLTQLGPESVEEHIVETDEPQESKKTTRPRVVGRKVVSNSMGERSIEGRDSVGLYLEEIARTPLLNAELEVELSKMIEAGLLAEHTQKARAAESISAYIDQLEADVHEPKEGQSHTAHQKIVENSKDIRTVVTRLATDKSLTDEELEWLAEEGRKAVDQFTTANLRLVVSIARKYGRAQMPMLDLIQEGNTGLMRAVEKFDYTKGYKFSTYATWWVRQAITRGIAQQARVVRLPVHVTEELNQVGGARRTLERQLGRDPEPQEIAEELGIEVNRVLDLMAWGRDHISLDTPINEDGDTSLGDLIAQETAPGPDQMVLDIESRDHLNALVAQLDERGADIIRSRYGLIDGRQQKLADIGSRHGISAERVRQLEREALQKLRRLGGSDSF